MAKTSNEQVADKIVSLLADSRISSIDWFAYIPFYITRHNKFVVSRAKNLADGINEVLADEEIGLPAELIEKYDRKATDA